MAGGTDADGAGDGRSRFREEDALTGYLRTQCGDLIRGEYALRQAEVDPAAVHDTRVAVRRLRSVLRTCAPLLTLSEQQRRDADEDLRWLAGLLSDIRDADVLEHRLTRQVEALPPSMVLGPALPDIVTALHQVRCRTVRHWTEQRTTDRFRATLRVVARWYDRPPVAGTPMSAKRLRREGAALLDRAERTARKRLRQADGDPRLLHRARKAVKRARYTAEALAPVLPEARRVVVRAKRLQSGLGEHQDLVVEAAFLRHLASVVGDQAGHNGFTYGVLAARAEQRAAEVRARRWRWGG